MTFLVYINIICCAYFATVCDTDEPTEETPVRDVFHAYTLYIHTICIKI